MRRWNYYYSYPPKCPWSIFRGNLKFSWIYCTNTCILFRSLAFLLNRRNEIKVWLCHLRGKRKLQHFVIFTLYEINRKGSFTHAFKYTKTRMKYSNCIIKEFRSKFGDLLFRHFDTFLPLKYCTLLLVSQSRSQIHEPYNNHECSQTWGFRIQCLIYKPVSTHFCSKGEGDKIL